MTGERIEFAAVGAEATPSTLAKTCPDSFPPFAEDVDQTLRRCAARGQASKRAKPRKRQR